MSLSTAELVTVPATADMPLQTLRRHIQARHSRLSFWSREQHDADHRSAEPSALDHEHQEQK